MTSGTAGNAADDRETFRATNRARVESAFTSRKERYLLAYGQKGATHRRMLRRFLGRVSAGSRVLDAACGPGVWFDEFVTTTFRPYGLDLSAGLLGLARASWPEVPVEQGTLESLLSRRDLHGEFGGVFCINALEWVLEDDWLTVLRGFRAVLRTGGLLYVTLEQPDEDEEERFRRPPPAQLLARELDLGNRINTFPELSTVMGWLSTAGFEIVERASGGGCEHVIAAAVVRSC